MKYFYWVMGLLIAGTLVPSVLCFVIYLITGADEWSRRASGFWTVSRVLTLFGINILVWGHVVVGVWQLAR